MEDINGSVSERWWDRQMEAIDNKVVDILNSIESRLREEVAEVLQGKDDVEKWDATFNAELTTWVEFPVIEVSVHLYDRAAVEKMSHVDRLRHPLAELVRNRFHSLGVYDARVEVR